MLRFYDLQSGREILEVKQAWNVLDYRGGKLLVVAESCANIATIDVDFETLMQRSEVTAVSLDKTGESSLLKRDILHVSLTPVTDEEQKKATLSWNCRVLKRSFEGDVI